MFFDLVVEPASAAFLDVTIFVASMIGLFGLLQWRFGEPLSQFLTRRWRVGPLLGALLGMFPGCGGAVLVMPLYVRGQVSFGTVIAALVATMGDSSFVLIAADPGLAVAVHGLLMVVGLVSGYAVDAVGYAPRRHVDAEQRVLQTVGGGRVTQPADTAPVPRCCGTDGSTRPGDVSGPPPLALGRRLSARASDAVGPALYWLLVALGALLVVPVLLRPEANTIADGLGTGTDIGLLVGLAGTATAAVLAWSERRARRRGQPRGEASEVVEVLRTTAFESARIAVWVTAAFVGMAVFDHVGLSVTALATLTGFAGIAAGVLLGLLPGCAPQIMLTGLYATGGLPLPTLLANALSQDGDALLPLLLMDRRSAVIASVLTMVPGLLVGTTAMLLGLGG